jgi:hypothetical protein
MLLTFVLLFNQGLSWPKLSVIGEESADSDEEN